jgi:BolA protein
MLVQRSIEEKLQNLQPLLLKVENESHMHSVPANSETHFKVTLVTDAFTGLRLLQRHRKINQLLAEELAGPVHALALHTFAPDEWERKHGVVPDSPNCLGGSKQEK